MPFTTVPELEGFTPSHPLNTNAFRRRIIERALANDTFDDETRAAALASYDGDDEVQAIVAWAVDAVLGAVPQPDLPPVAFEITGPDGQISVTRLPAPVLDGWTVRPLRYADPYAYAGEPIPQTYGRIAGVDSRTGALVFTGEGEAEPLPLDGQ